MDRAVVKGNHAAALFWFPRTINMNLRIGAQLLQRIGGEFFFMCAHIFHADLIQIVDGGTKGDDTRYIGSSRLKFPRKFVPIGMISPYFQNHVNWNELPWKFEAGT